MNNFAPLEISVHQGAKLWNISPNTIYDRIRKKELQLNENGKITPSEMSRTFGSPKPKQKVQWISKNEQWTAQIEQLWTVQISLLEQALNFEQERTKDLQNRLNEANERLKTQEKQSTSYPRKKFLGIF